MRGSFSWAQKNFGLVYQNRRPPCLSKRWTRVGSLLPLGEDFDLVQDPRQARIRGAYDEEHGGQVLKLEASELDVQPRRIEGFRARGGEGRLPGRGASGGRDDAQEQREPGAGGAAK